jgi:hypothetical protein
MARLGNIDRVKVLPILIDELEVSELPLDIQARQFMRFPLPRKRKSFGLAIERFVQQLRSFRDG